MLDGESDSDDELQSVLSKEAFDDQVEFEFECRICRRRRWCTLCRDHRFCHRFCLLCERCLDVNCWPDTRTGLYSFIILTRLMVILMMMIIIMIMIMMMIVIVNITSSYGKKALAFQLQLLSAPLRTLYIIELQ